MTFSKVQERLGEGPAMVPSSFVYEGTSVIKKIDLKVLYNKWQPL